MLNFGKTVDPDRDHLHVNSKVKLMQDRIFIRTKHISHALIIVQGRVLETKKSSITFKKKTTKNQSIPTGTSQIVFLIVYQRELPDVLILDIVSDTVMTGGGQANPFHFQRFGAKYLCIQANWDQITMPAINRILRIVTI